MFSQIRDYLKLPPHEQFLRGLVGVALYVTVVPAILFVYMIVIVGISLGTTDLGSMKLMLWLAYVAGVLLLLFGILMPVLLLLRLSHKFSKQLGRGDEHLIFYIGLAILALTWLFGYKPYINSTYEQTLGATQIMFFYPGNIFGLGLIVTGLILLCRLSKRYSTTVADANPARQ